MKNTSQKIEVLGYEPNQQQVKVRFIATGLEMTLTKELLQQKLNNGFYIAS